MGVSETLQAVQDSSLKNADVFTAVTILQRTYTAVVQGVMAIQTLTAKNILKDFDPSLAEAIQLADVALRDCQTALQGAKSLDMLIWTPTAAAVPEG